MATEHTEHGDDFDPTCPACVQQACSEEFRAAAGPAPVRVTEATEAAAAVDDGAMAEALAAVLEGLDDAGVSELAELAEAAIAELASKATEADVDEHAIEAHIGFRKLKAKLAARGAHDPGALAAWIGRKKYGRKAFQALAKSARAAKSKLKGKKASEAHISGQMSFDDVKDAVRRALRARVASETGRTYCWVSVLDLTSSEVVYCADGGGMDSPYDDRDLMLCGYTIDQAGTVTLGTPTEVVRTYAPAPPDGDEGQAAGEATGWDSAKHPRGKAGTSAGGRFVALSYDSSKKTGTGYGSKQGDSRVRQLQEALNRLGVTDSDGHRLAVDGKLGPLTTSAVEDAQRRLGVKADGRVTPELLARLRKAKALHKPKAAGKTPASKAVPAAKGKAAMGKESEERDHVDGRVLEAKGEASDGGRIYRVRIIAYGDSKNGRRYPESVLQAAAPMYEGARAYDHHRTEAELRSSTIHGLVGSYRNVEATADGIDADLHLLPSATHAAEALDATITAQEAGLQPLVGLSHDVMARFRPVVDGSKRLQEATAITKVHSADLVADPAAGGQATRAVAGGIEDGTGTEPAGQEEDDVPPTKEDVLGVLAEATDEELAKIGLGRRAAEGEGQEERGTEALVPKTGFMAALMIERKVEAAKLPAAVIEGITAALPEQICEADVDAQISSLKATIGIAERAGLAAGGGSVTVTQEAREKKIAALDAFFARDWSKGYRSFKEAFADFTDRRPRTFDEDFNRIVLQESFGAGYYSGRAEESMSSGSWAQVLGDSVTRRMVAMYGLPSLQTWRPIVSSIVPVNDFRTQRITRVGGYGTLPDVNEGAPYQPLTSPTDEEATWAPGKKGGTEDLTIEMVANDDVRAISNIPKKLGRAAAQTLYRFVWDFVRTNATCTYDGVALFHANHANLGSTALSATTLAAARQALMEQVAYDDDQELLDLDIVNLIVPPALYDLAFKLVKSERAVTSNEDATTPNINQGVNLIRVPYFNADDNNWYVTADPDMVPTIELGFYQGRQDPELFSQSDPNVGSVFDADKITYKIRHIYGGGVIDHRGMYGAIVAGG